LNDIRATAIDLFNYAAQFKPSMSYFSTLITIILEYRFKNPRYL
jgi:hypothetical protein